MAEAAGLADADDDDDPVCDDDDPVVSEYFRTIKRGRVDEVKRLLLDEGNNISVNHVSDTGWTPLTLACACGHVDVARLLIERGAGVGQANDDGESPLLMACANGHVDVARLLIEKNADITQAVSGFTPLDAAKHSGHAEIVRLLEGRSD